MVVPPEQVQLAEVLPMLCVSLPSSTLTIAGAVRALAELPRAPESGPPLLLTIMLALTGCTLALIVGVLVVGFVLSIGRGKGNKDGEKNK